jgi:hypothetical protein
MYAVKTFILATAVALFPKGLVLKLKLRKDGKPKFVINLAPFYHISLMDGFF